MLTSWSEVSTPAELSMKSVLSSTPCMRRLDAAALGHAQVAALAHHLAAQLVAVDAQGVVGAVADVGMRFAAGLDVGADAAVPEQVDRRLEDRVHQLVRRHLRRRRRRCRAPRALPARPGSTWPSADRRRRPRRSAPCRSRPSSSAAARTCARARRTTRRIRVRDRGRCGGGRTRPAGGCARDSSMPLPNTSPDMSPTPTHGEVLRLAIAAQRAEVALDRFPGALGGDAHALVVVADRAAGGEGVAQPEAVLGARCRWRCRRRSPCPCRRRPPGTGSSPSWRTTSTGCTTLPSTRLSVMSSRPLMKRL